MGMSIVMREDCYAMVYEYYLVFCRNWTSRGGVEGWMSLGGA